MTTWIRSIVLVAGISLVPASSSHAQDFGDGPDGIAACQLGDMCTTLSLYPTVAGTVNAVAGRTSPVHTSAAAPGGDYFFGTLPTAEPAAHQPCCDWWPPETVCDEDDIAAIMCVGAASCANGMVVASLPTFVSCGLGYGTFPFGPMTPIPPLFPVAPACVLGPAPGGIPAGGFASVSGGVPAFWVVPVAMGAAEAPAAAPRFLNVAVDSDLSGIFGDLATEWVLADAPVAFLPGMTQVFTTGAFAVSVTVTTHMPPGALPPPADAPVCTVSWGVDGVWTRFTVGPEAITTVPPFLGGAIWDGSGAVGGYTRGETEDWYTFGDPESPTRPEPELDPDCQPNGIPDLADIALGNSLDANFDGVPDECGPQIPVLSLPGTVFLLFAMSLMIAGAIHWRQRANRPT